MVGRAGHAGELQAVGHRKSRGLTMTDAVSGDIKSEAHRLIDALPDDATWDDIMYRVYVRQCIDAGVQDADAGRTVDVDEVRRRFGLTT